VFLPADELATIDKFRFEARVPSQPLAVRAQQPGKLSVIGFLNADRCNHPCIHRQPHCRRTTLIIFYLIGATLRATLGREGPKLRGESRNPMAVF
jgi:hypothetical protein